jgi:hypothetical protein
MRGLRISGLTMGAGVVGLAFWAAGEDEYYGDGTTRWGHATKDGGADLLTALFALSATIACVFILLSFFHKRVSELWLIPAFAVYGLSMLVAWAALSVGH